MVFQLLQNMASGHIKGTGHVFYMVTPNHATESLQNDTSISMGLQFEPPTHIFCKSESPGSLAQRATLKASVSNFDQNFNIHTLRCDIHDEQVHRLASSP